MDNRGPLIKGGIAVGLIAAGAAAAFYGLYDHQSIITTVTPRLFDASGQYIAAPGPDATYIEDTTLIPGFMRIAEGTSIAAGIIGLANEVRIHYID